MEGEEVDGGDLYCRGIGTGVLFVTLQVVGEHDFYHYRFTPF
jgi:hypothetical protein